MQKLTAMFLGLLFAALAGAAEIGGVKLSDRVSIAGSDLVLNGAGVRSRMGLDIYVAALYLPQKQANPGSALASNSPRRIQMTMLLDAGADQLVGSLVDGLAKNNPKTDMDAMKPQVEQLGTILRGLREVRNGQALAFDYIPGTGTVVSLDGAAKGTIPGDAFNAAIAKIWLGDEPVSKDLKKAMLGG